MEPNSNNQIAAVDSSGQLALNHTAIGGGPINQMPNEIMLLIFGKLKLKLGGDNNNKNGDGAKLAAVNDVEDDDDNDKDGEDDESDDDDEVFDKDDDDDEDSEDDESNNYADNDGVRYYYDAIMLVKLRLVCKKWNSLVEKFCRQKKVLNVNTSFSNRAFKSSVSLVVNLQTFDFFGKMLKLFPNVVQLAVDNWADLDDTQIRDFAVKINSLSSLKQLKLEGDILAALPHLAQTLAKLEYLEVDTLSSVFTGDHLPQFVSSLGPDCSLGVFLDEYCVNHNNMLQWHNKNPHFFANLTHLQMYFRGEPEDCAKIMHFLSENATSLEFLAFYAWTHTDPLEMSPTVIRDLGKLTKLTHVKLWRSEIPELEDVQDGLTLLSSVLTCELFIKYGPIKADNFTRVLSAIFPNVVNLHLDICDDFSDFVCRQFLRQIKQNLNQFPNLRNHKVRFGC